MRQEENGATEDEMIRRHHRLNGHEFEQIPGDSGGQRSLVDYSSWGRKESDMTEQLTLSLFHTILNLGWKTYFNSS